jgi:cytochrome P450
MSARFVPPHPPRPPAPVATWRGFLGERARTAVYGWSERAFSLPAFTRDVLGFRVHVISKLEWIGEVLLDQAAQFTKPDIVRRVLAPVVGEGLLTAEDDLWRAERKIVAASFTPAAVEEHRALFDRAADESASGWADGEVRDLAAEATRTTMQVIALALFGGDRRLVSDEAMAEIAAALEGFSQPRMQALFGLPMVPIGRKARAGARGQRYLRETLGRLVDERIAGRGGDWLAGLIAALGRQFDGPTARALAIDNAATFYLAGHETTANALGWTLYLLGAQPDLQEQLAAEAQTALASGWEAPGLSARLPLLHAALQESMRLYPPVPRLDRQARARLAVGDREVGPGDIVSIWPWLVHRHRDLWDDPDAFVADRFLAGTRHRFQYLPFGGGPRICVGAHFATIEALTVLARWLADWRFVAAGPVRVSGLVTLRPAPGVPLRLERRSP